MCVKSQNLTYVSRKVTHMRVQKFGRSEAILTYVKWVTYVTYATYVKVLVLFLYTRLGD